MKMIQNLESKMELQMNSLETKIEKMQEMFNKDLEEIKKALAFSHRVQKSVLYICVSFSILHIGLSLPSF